MTTVLAPIAGPRKAPQVPEQAIPRVPKGPTRTTADRFEVISIRPADPVSAIAGGRGGGQRGEGAGSAPVCPPGPIGSVQLDPSRITFRNVTVYRLIALAYGKNCRAATEMNLISGTPGWAETDRFDIEAVIPSGATRYTAQQLAFGKAPQLQLMLQNFLADRFHLALHRTSKEAPLYDLVLVNGGKIALSEDQTPPPQLPAPAGPVAPEPQPTPARRRNRCVEG